MWFVCSACSALTMMTHLAERTQHRGCIKTESGEWLPCRIDPEPIPGSPPRIAREAW